jgi:hypothetical protein
MSAPNDRISHENQNGSQSNGKQNPNHMSSQILEHGDIFFFYRPKVGAREISGIDDIRRFFMITATDSRQPGTEIDGKMDARIKEEKQDSIRDGEAGDRMIATDNASTWYRLFTIGKKSLPEVRHTEARRSERYWAKIGGIFHDSKVLTNELLSSEYREGDSARPVGEGKYAIISHKNHAELAYVLEMPKEPGKAQKELGIEKEASYIVSVINPKVPVPEGYPSTEQPPQYPESILVGLESKENFIPLSKDIRLIDYLNAQVILIGAREGKDVLMKEIGIDIKEEEETEQTADIFGKLQIERKRTPIRPLVEGKFE